MCAGLAHEASQPLNAATLWLRRVRAAAQGLPEAQRAPLVQAAQVVDDQLRRAGALIEQIRSLAEEDPRTAESFDAARPVAAAMRLAAARYAAEGIAIAFEGSNAPLPVRGSATRLEQAVLQLLSNACDAVLERRQRDPMAPARVDVLLRRAGGAVAIEVRDSGAGVPAGLVPMIFDPFFTTKEPGRGSGLGLALAAGVARAMDGGIETWNLPSGGACFRMELALAEPLPVGAPGAVAAA
jgi:C4-dicarboxylate-specific signal transduction histidine kinase